MPNLTDLADTEENRALLNPNFRKAISIFSDMKEKHGIDVCDYDSFEVYMLAFFSSLDTVSLEHAECNFDFDGAIGEALDTVLNSSREFQGVGVCHG